MEAQNNWCWETGMSYQSVCKHWVGSECEDCETVQEWSVLNKVLNTD